jgi:hypothetical protein
MKPSQSISGERSFTAIAYRAQEDEEDEEELEEGEEKEEGE